MVDNKKFISSLKSKGLSAESIKPPATSDNSLSPLIDYLGNKIRVKFILFIPIIHSRHNSKHLHCL